MGWRDTNRVHTRIRMRILRWERREAGLCRCGSPLTDEHRTCRDCRIARAIKKVVCGVVEMSSSAAS